MLTHLSLFSGIGGLDLAADWAGFKTVGQCEWADYPTKVLEKHWPDVPRWRDIRTLTAEDFYARTGRKTVDIISGGFPCQPFSVAGKQKGKGDDRYLWPEMLRVIRELKPRWVVGENVPGILRIAAADVVADLEREGFDVVVFDFEAAAVGANHRRERIAFVANAIRGGCGENGRRQSMDGVRKRWTHYAMQIEESSTDVSDAGRNGQSASEVPRSIDTGGDTGKSGTVITCEFTGCGQCNGRKNDVAHTDKQGLQGRDGEKLSECARQWVAGEGGTSVCDTTTQRLPLRTTEPMGKPQQVEQLKRPNWWSIEPNVGRVANGIPNRVDRLKCLGNAVVPQQFYPIFKAIAICESENKEAQ